MNESLHPGIAFGANAGCPFCRATLDIRTTPKAGTRFRFLTGYDAGECGTVLDYPSPISDDRFLAKMDYETGNIQRRVTSRDLIEILPLSPIPNWAPPLELRSAAELDDVVAKFCDSGNRPNHWVIDWIALFEIIRFVWQKRLPLEPIELWAVIDAHGAPNQFQLAITDFYQKGRDLLIYSNGKRPVKKKRVHPFAT